MHNFHLALVTGASSGIGEALCNLLAEKGIPLLIAGRNTIQLNSLADRLRNKVNVTVCSSDLSEDREQLIKMVKDLNPDLVINNAGFGLYGEVLDSFIEKQREMIQVNLEALFEINLESGRMMRQRGLKGVIVNISSVAAFPVFPCFSVYSATKAFVLNFSQSFAVLIKELRLLARAVFVVDKEGIIRYVQYVKEMTDQPDYDRVLKEAEKLL